MAQPINQLSFKARSLLFAQLSAIAYSDLKEAKAAARKLEFSTVEFYDVNGAQAYRFMNKYDCIIACRGTQPLYCLYYHQYLLHHQHTMC